ncbi:bacteriohopanetetrol glucosamine biosynthesis glycosyltransferase HpnI [Roseococcus thiosulfatophilus]|uniref:bacteriohopanetetrol glucosamine biosynthesis glycosyltransferase HpnI n=1 Tax=Roseococcus thiosulfatophilus TaxID=35813 RepID=UPI001A8F13EA|nr:bacteriohopanetetrol glucosamine biosynthesis glycosyltransferase HpnI [Roseococcus thiosulfatophilus]
MNLAAMILGLLAVAGLVQALAARRALGRMFGRVPPAGPALPASVLKPLHGNEPGLEFHLSQALAQQHAAPYEVLFAVANPADPARAVAEAAMARSATPSRLLAGGEVLGANRKVSQQVHMARVAKYPVLVAADSDMACPPHWLTTVTAPLSDPEVGLVTCLYAGLPADDGPWSELAALSINWHFLPNAALGESLGAANGAYGATLALRADTLARIGGYERLLPLLADDHALGEAVRELGLKVVVPPILPGHVMHEPSFQALWAHELRWARTTRLVHPWGHVGLVFTHPLPFALGALALAPGAWTLALLGAVLLARGALARRADVLTGRPRWRRMLWLPIRDLLSFAVWATALHKGRVTWQGRRFTLGAGGRMAEAPEPTREAVS